MLSRATINPTLFLHIGWARQYRGSKDDPPQGGFGYLTEGNEHAGEALNFHPFKGRCFGYAPLRAINMERLGGNVDDEEINGVLVVWTASEPDGSGRYVVGWYKNARVYARMRNVRPHKIAWVICEAAAEDCHLVPIDERTFFVPRMRPGWPGISSAFFASDTLSQKSIDTLLAYIDGQPSAGFIDSEDEVRRRPGGLGRNSDPELRSKVEGAAVRLVWTFYEALNWQLESVEGDRCGWDITATCGRRQLFIEVKGRLTEGPVELTPNEYSAMISNERRMSYRLAIVYDALSNSPRVVIFKYVAGSRLWASKSGQVLKVFPRIGATVEYL